MTYFNRPTLSALCGFLLFIAAILPWSASQAEAKGPKYLFKVASLAPEGSLWAKRFRDFSNEVSARTNGEVGFKIYTGGVMGDDRSMYRKMRIGQLQGGGFTMAGLGEIVPDFRVLGVPFMFTSYDEVDYVSARLLPRLRQEFAKQGMVLMAMSEVGFIHTLSTSPISTLDELRSGKCWAPEGDPISMVFLQTAGITPIPLTIPDVLTSLQTGLVNTVFNSFYGAIVLQWFTHTRYISDVPFVYAYGVFALDDRSFSRLPPEYAAAMQEIAGPHFAGMIADTRQGNLESLDALKQNSSILVKAAPATLAELENIRRETVTKLTGNAFSESIYQEALGYLQEYRSKK